MSRRWIGAVAVGVGLALAAGWSVAALVSDEPGRAPSAASAQGGLEPVAAKKAPSLDAKAVVTGPLPTPATARPTPTPQASATPGSDSPASTATAAPTAAATAPPQATATAQPTPVGGGGDLQP